MTYKALLHKPILTMTVHKVPVNLMAALSLLHKYLCKSLLASTESLNAVISSGGTLRLFYAAEHSCRLN